MENQRNQLYQEQSKWHFVLHCLQLWPRYSWRIHFVHCKENQGYPIEQRIKNTKQNRTVPPKHIPKNPKTNKKTKNKKEKKKKTADEELPFGILGPLRIHKMVMIFPWICFWCFILEEPDMKPLNSKLQRFT